MNLGDVKDHDIDAFGDAYEYLMTMYASNAGKVRRGVLHPGGCVGAADPAWARWERRRSTRCTK